MVERALDRNINPISIQPTPPFGSPAYFRRSAMWWWYHAKRSASPSRCLDYARSQLRLAKWLEANPKARPLSSETHWQMFQRLSQEVSI